MAKPEGKTNAIRALDAAGVCYQFRTFDCDAATPGVEIARMLGTSPDSMFKTLVTRGKSGGILVFMVPTSCELDLKKAAATAGEKAVCMVKSRELLPLTGYIHGGCSPIGMKKSYPTFVDETAQLYDHIMFSGGRIGCQVELAPDDLAAVISFSYADLTV